MKKIILMYAKIGYEIGNIVRIFYEHKINWGYYADHDDNNFHCNFHPNNFIILP